MQTIMKAAEGVPIEEHVLINQLATSMVALSQASHGGQAAMTSHPCLITWHASSLLCLRGANIQPWDSATECVA